MRVTAITIALLLLTTLARGELDPLPEEAKIKGRTLVSEFRLLGAPPGRKEVFVWTGMTLEKGTLDGQVVYLSRQVAEIADITQGKVRCMAETGLWSDNLELLALRFTGLDKGKPVTWTYRWDEGKLLRYRNRSSKPKAMKSTTRPQAGVELQLLTRPMKEKEERSITYLDTESMTIKSSRIKREPGNYGKTATIQKFTVDAPKSTAYLDPQKHQIVQAEISGLTMGRTDADAHNCSLTLCRNMVLQGVMLTKARADWRKKSGGWTNGFLKIKLKLPRKGWARTEGKLGDFIVFQAQSEDQKASLLLAMEACGKGLTLDNYVPALINSVGPLAHPKGVVKQSKDKLAGQPAVRLDYARKMQDQIVQLSIWVFIKDGFAYRVLRSQLADQAALRAKDYQKILRSIKLTR